MKFNTVFAGLLVISVATTSSSNINKQHITYTKDATLHTWLEEPAFDDDNLHHQMYEYVLVAMREWAPSNTIVETHSQQHFSAFAKDLVTVALDPGEPSLFSNDAYKAKSAVLLATIAYFEGHFWDYVDDGRCNHDPDNKLLVNGHCDHNKAFSLWQLHVDNGVVITEDGLWAWNLQGNGIKGDDIINDRKLAAKLAMHMLRSSLKYTHSLCEYTGERKPNCVKAKQRMDFAVKYSTKHPFEFQSLN